MTTGLRVADAHPGARALGERLVPFYPPVDTDLFRPAERLSKDALVVGTVANLTPQKGLEHLVAAADRIRSRLPQTRIVVFGRPMESQTAYETSLRALAAGSAVEIVDPGDAVGDRLRELDVFVMTSVPRSEGVSTTVLEAMATGLPVVTTDVGALREVVEHGVTGLVVPPLDPDAIAGAALHLLEDAEVRGRMGATARERAVARYGLAACVESHLRAFEVARRHREAA
jgi:glycosyltransferase involved in cell wall biosynthesis